MGLLLIRATERHGLSICEKLGWAWALVVMLWSGPSRVNVGKDDGRRGAVCEMLLCAQGLRPGADRECRSGVKDDCCLCGFLGDRAMFGT